LAGEKITIRFLTDRYTTGVIIHCHLLHHEDTGMMMQVGITTDGSKKCDGVGVAAVADHGSPASGPVPPTSAPTSSPTTAPTNAPTPPSVDVSTQVVLAGITNAQFGATEQTAFKTTVGSNAGTVCGTTALLRACTAGDVALTLARCASGLTYQSSVLP